MARCSASSAALLGALAFASCRAPDDGYAVDLTIVADNPLAEATINGLRTLDIALTGAETKSKSYPLATPFANGRQERVIIRPSAPSGDLTISVTARDAMGGPVATGKTVVALRPGATVTATVLLGPYSSAGGEIRLLGGLLGGAGYLDGTGPGARLAQPSTAALDGKGNLFVADAGNDLIRKVILATGEVSTFAGVPRAGNRADGIATEAHFHFPRGILYDGAGLLYVSDGSTNAIRTVDATTGTVATLIGNGYGSLDGSFAMAQFANPRGLALYQGSLYVADATNDTLRRIDLVGGQVTTIAGQPGVFGSADGVGAAARFNGPIGLASDGTGNLFLADTANDTIRQIVLATGAVTTLAGQAGAGGSTNGIGPAARFANPSGLDCDKSGNLYVADTDGHILRKIVTATGEVSTIAGKPGAYDWQDGIGAAARFRRPKSVTVDPAAGLLYVLEFDNHTVRRVDLATLAVTTVAGSPPNIGLREGAADMSLFSNPNGIVADAAGDLYVADTDNNCLRKIAMATRQVTTFAGDCRTGGDVDGIGTNARLSGPLALAIDGQGNLYFSAAYTIRKAVIATAEVTTLAGVYTKFGSNDGVGPAAHFGTVLGLYPDGAGGLIVADTTNHALRRLDLATREVRTVAGTLAKPGSTDGPSGLLSLPIGLVPDGSGGLYVSTAGSHTLRKTTLGTWGLSTFTGAPNSSGFVDGAAGKARFDAPGPMTLDAAGNLIVYDQGSGTLRRVTVSNGAVTTLAGVPYRFAIEVGPLPARLNDVSGIARLPDGTFALISGDENVILLATLP